MNNIVLCLEIDLRESLYQLYNDNYDNYDEVKMILILFDILNIWNLIEGETSFIMGLSLPKDRR